MKEIKVTTNYNYTESFFTEDKEFVTKKERGCDMIGFKKIGKKRNTWIPLGMNVSEVVIIEDGKEVEKYTDICWNKREDKSVEQVSGHTVLTIDSYQFIGKEKVICK